MSDITQPTSRLPRKTYKRPYKKSTKGCSACKARKIKCDEFRPACSNCRKRFADINCCVYKTASRPIDSSSVSSRNSIQGNPRSPALPRAISVTPTSNGASNLLELRLMHHYTKSTCSQSSLTAMVPLLSHPMWEIDIPQIAFSSDIVLNALLAISALDLSSLNPHDKSLTTASKSYFYKAVANHRVAVAKIDAHNAQSLLVAAVLIAHHTWLSAHSQPPEEPYVVSINTFNMCQGILALVDRTPVLECYSWPVTASKDHSNNNIRHARFLRSALQDMKALSEIIDTSRFTLDDVETYKRAAQEVVEIYYLVAGGSASATQIEQAIVTFLHRVPRRLISLLKNNEPVALAILVRNISVLGLVDDSKAWWIHGSGNNKVATRAVYGIRTLMPDEWLWAMAWPMKVALKEVKLDLD